jgi:transglutaminase-like putative cysteine protease
VLRGPDTRALAAAGRRVGFASVLLALCAPLLVPGLHAARLTSTTWVFGPGGGGNGSNMPDPLSQTGVALQESKPKTAFTYTTTAPVALRELNPQYLQQYVMTLTDSGWQIGGGNGLTTHSFNTQLPPQADGVSNSGSLLVTTVVSYPGTAGHSSDTTAFLAAPFPPIRVYVTGSWQVDQETLMLVSPRSSTAGLTYQVVSADVNPSQGTLRGLQVPSGMGKYTQLPVAYKQSHELLSVAERITNGQGSVFDKAQALTDYLHNNGHYNLYGPVLSSPQSLLSFMSPKSMIGDCVQYAEAATIMMRMRGIPARLAVGYTQGTEVPARSGHYVVQNADAHAWPEVFFAGYGWVRFEPTPPGQGSATAPGFESTPASTGPSVTTPGTSAGQTSATNKGGTLLGPGRKIVALPNDGGPDSGTLTSAKKHSSAPWTAIVLAVLAAIALAFGIIAIVAPASRRLLAARPGSAAERIGRVNIGGVLIAVGISAGVVALALYRMLSRTSGLNLGAGWATVGIAFGASCAAALALPTLSRAALRRWRWARASDDEARAHAAWLELCADLADYGIGYSPSESPRAVAARLRSGLVLAEPAAEAVGRIALAEEYASYAGRAPDSPQTLHKDGTAARRGIARAAGKTARWRARIFPASTLTTLSDAAGHLSDIWRRLTPRPS